MIEFNTDYGKISVNPSKIISFQDVDYRHCAILMEQTGCVTVNHSYDTVKNMIKEATQNE